jgi:hypothetical protein
MTHDAKSYIVDIDASLAKTLGLSKNAEHLYYALRRLADGKSGELRFKDGTWMKATYFQKAARVCRNVRLRCMGELIRVGLVSMKRPRKLQEIRGRIRAVSGGCQYTVFKCSTPKVGQKPNDSSRVLLQKSFSSTVEEKDPQVFPETPIGASGSVLGSGGENSVREHRSSSSESPAETPSPDDRDVCFPIRENHELNVNPNSQPNPATKEGQNQNHLTRIDRQIEKIKARAQTFLEGRGGLDSIYVRQAILLIDSRAIEIPASVNYYLTAFEALGLEDLYKIEEEVKWIRANGTRAEKNIAFVHDIVETADRTGQSAADVLRELVHPDKPK